MSVNKNMQNMDETGREIKNSDDNKTLASVSEIDSLFHSLGKFTIRI